MAVRQPRAPARCAVRRSSRSAPRASRPVGKTALITGITGQDGTYLAEHLLEQGYRAVGVLRGQNNPKRAEVSRLIPKLEFVEGDLTDLASLIAACEEVRPDEIYNLGAISF